MSDLNGPINWQEVLKITNNKPELAKEMVSMLVAELPQMKTDVNNLAKTENYQQLLDVVHKLHGSCCYCGVTKLKAVTAKIEADLKQANYKNLNKDITVLNEEINTILDYVNNETIV